jgi:prepilin-type N-terminal cleavage/methylation domain-containing protein
MKNKKGFTLIELLAVIVVLAIIALIATPIVMNTIKNAKKGAAERSADNYVKAVEQKVAESRIDGTKIANGTYNIQPDGNLCPASGCGENDKDKITIDMSGTKPTSGTVTISNGEVSQEETIMTVGDYGVGYKNGKISATDLSTELSKNLCVFISGETSYSFGAQYVCELGDGEKRTFYVLEDGDTTSLIYGRTAQAGEVSLIMSENLGDDVAWCTKEDYIASGGTASDFGSANNNKGALTAKAALSTRTANWNKITNKAKITLPTAHQIAAASGKTFNYVSIIGIPKWLSNSIYWTQTGASNNKNYAAYFVSDDNSLYEEGVILEPIGIHPVITISKSNLS